MDFEKMEEYARRQEALCEQNDQISDNLFLEYGVKRGLRDENGVGVLTGLTNISMIRAFTREKGKKVPCDGELWYRGHPIQEVVSSIPKGTLGFERTAYLLLFGEFPDEKEMSDFRRIMSESCALPTNFVRDVVMKAPSKDIMNSMTRSILTLASYDENAGSTGLANVIRQCIMLISIFPMLATYSYHAYNHYENHDSMYIHRPEHSLSTAENFLRMLRPDKTYTPLEAKVLDAALILHMEHGGGNNSTFTDRVVTSSGSDTYSAIAAAMCSLKGPKHGGANIKVMEMMNDIRSHVHDWEDRDEVRYYLEKIARGEAFDRQGLVYGMGHAVYTVSDPRERILKSFVAELAKAKGRERDMDLYQNIEELAPDVINGVRRRAKPVSPNVDFYSGFIYDMLNIPVELYTPLFATARIVGWSAHRMEELITGSKIIRPAYKSVMEEL